MEDLAKDVSFKCRHRLRPTPCTQKKKEEEEKKEKQLSKNKGVGLKLGCITYHVTN
jgi:hypothetical protein